MSCINLKPLCDACSGSARCAGRPAASKSASRLPPDQTLQEIEAVAVALQLPHLTCRSIFPSKLLCLEHPEISRDAFDSRPYAFVLEGDDLVPEKGQAKVRRDGSWTNHLSYQHLHVQPMPVVHVFEIFGEAGLHELGVEVFEDCEDASQELLEGEGLEMAG